VKLHSKDLAGTTFLVTGGAGFIGSHLTDYLLVNGAKKVVVLDDLSTGFERNLDAYRGRANFQFINGSITELDACRAACTGVDIVLHHAALGSVPRSIENPVRTNEVNVSGFVNMLFAAKEAAVKKIVYASSSSVYGDDNTFPKVESKTGNLLSPYAVSKRTNEEYAKVFARLYNMEVTGLRYFNVFGERQTPEGPYAAVIPKFIDALIHGRSPAIYGDGNNTRDFTYVANVIRANMQCIEAADLPKGIVMNIACGGTISVNDIFRQVASALKSEVKPQYLPERPGEIKNSYADIGLASKTIGYSPAVSLSDGLKRTVDWFVAKSK
jgi:UDP-N-acetylglucosamine/UDP-N-acetylgalactosamine 4-epimerase